MLEKIKLIPLSTVNAVPGDQLITRRSALHWSAATLIFAAINSISKASASVKPNDTDLKRIARDMTEKSMQPSSALATKQQRLTERRALDIFSSATVKSAMAKTLASFIADPNAKLADQKQLMQQSVNEHYFHSSLMAASETPRSPAFIWCIALPHQWMGLDVPGSRFGHDNTDNAYRIAAIEPTLQYKITGHFAGPRPCDFSICVLPRQVGDDIAADVKAIIAIDEIDVDAEGYFSITVDASATAGRRNHLCIADGKVLFARDTLANWEVERASELNIQRTDGPTVDDFDATQAVTRAAALGATIANFFLKNVQHGMFERAPINTIPVPVPSGPRGGLTTQLGTVGFYTLNNDEALVISADRLGARYLGIQIIDMWMVSYEYSQHTSSLNHEQAVANADGRYRWVVSAQDPGVLNWLDSGGNAHGNVLMRWQKLPAGIDINNCVSAQIVKLSALREVLPPDTQYLDAQAREEQRARRLQSYQWRVV
ncbi:MAG: hypothetical protein JWM78_1000 [Verrucomicrobiaceae bacterium]|nr:hypothetical protein [Verrucomicrobiaceae bacterium]